MSTVAILIREPEPSAELLVTLQRLTGRSLQDLRQAIATREPVYQASLLFNDQEERAAELRRLVDALSGLESRAEAYHLEEHETLAECAPGCGYGLDTCWINPKGLEAPADLDITHVVASVAELPAILEA